MTSPHQIFISMNKPLASVSNAFFNILLFVVVSLSYSQFSYGQEVTTVNHYGKGFSPIFRVYLTEVLKTALDKTIEEYGPYKLQFYSKHLSTTRSKIETEKGVILDILFASHWNGRYIRAENVISIEAPVLKGLLGLRTLVVHDDTQEAMNQVQTLFDFKQFSAGLGANWEDVQILLANDVPVTEAQSFDALFPMLAKKRYDYLPLSCLEVQTALRTKGIAYENLQPNNAVSIFYPMPFYLYVNAKKPGLAERFRKGLELSVNDGTIDALFERHFGSIKKDFDRNLKKLVILKNPLLSHDLNDLVTDQFLSQYQQYFEVIN